MIIKSFSNIFEYEVIFVHSVSQSQQMSDGLGGGQ
jgi:hypothetical protein